MLWSKHLPNVQSWFDYFMAKQNRRKKGRHRGAASRANNDLMAHIASLDLETVEEYRSWCHAHGLTAALNKGWQERRQERQLVERDRAKAGLEKEQMKHVEALGLETVEAYQAWCREQGLSESANKGAGARRKELDLMVKLRSQAALERVKRHTRRPAETIAQIFAGEIEGEELQTDYLRRIQEVAKGVKGEVRDALLRLLLHAEKRTNLLNVEPAVDRLGAIEGNCYIDGLAALAGHSSDWLAEPEKWRPKSRNPRRQFGELVRHLLARYEVPTCMDSAWFRGAGDEGRRQQEWFKHVGGGQNIRKADLPLELSKKMAHLFLQVPGDLTVEEALRWVQVVGQGGSEQLVQAVLESRRGDSVEHEEFWGTVVLFLVNNPMLDPEWVGPIVDYINEQKFVPRETALPDGTVEQGEPAQPNYVMKGRSPVKLLGQVEVWHAHLARENRYPPSQWAPSGFGEFRYDDEELNMRWEIRELCSTRELNAEGRDMHHCVASYASNCRRGSKSVWSMQVETPEGDRFKILTIAVRNGSRRLAEVRGKHNALPIKSGRNPKQKSLEKAYRQLLGKSGKILNMWMDQEGMARSRSTR